MRREVAYKNLRISVYVCESSGVVVVTVRTYPCAQDLSLPHVEFSFHIASKYAEKVVGELAEMFSETAKVVSK